MSDAGNPYRAPEAPIAEPIAVEPRPFFMFLAAAICCGAGVLALLLTMVFAVGLVRICLDEGWQSVLTHKFGPKAFAFGFLSFYCLVTFMAAARLFFVRKGRLGRRFLLAALVGVGLFVLFAVAIENNII